MFIDRYIDYLNNKVQGILFEISKRAYLVYSIDKELSGVSEEKAKEIYVNVLRDILSNEIDKAEIDSKIDEMKMIFIRNMTDNGKFCEEVFDIFDKNMDKLLYVESHSKLCNFIGLINSEKELPEGVDPKILDETKELIYELDAPFSILQSMQGARKGKNYLLRIQMSEFLKELEDSDLKIRDKCKILESYSAKLVVDCAAIAKNKVKLDDKEKDIYGKIQKVYEKYNITRNTLEVTPEEFRNIYSEFGASKEFIDAIIEFKTIEISKEEKEEKIFDLNINSGLDEYTKKEEKRENLINKLSEYVDLRDLHSEKFLCRKEMNLVISIMKTLNYEPEDIKKVIWNNDLLLNKEDIIIKCNYIIDRARFYSSKYGFDKEFKDFEEYYNGYFSSKDKEEKALYLEFLSSTYNEINSFLSSIPRNYEYEFSIDKNSVNKVLEYKNSEE